MATIDDVRRANKSAGHFWFEPDTMRFFSSVVETQLIADKYFVTSEKPPNGRRRFTVRIAIDGGREIGTVGEFLGYKGLASARKAITAIVAAEKVNA